MESYDWTMFFDEYASDLHTTFRREISKQLFEKIAIKTGLKQFEKYNFQLIIGMNNLYKQVINNKMYAQIDIITPTSMGLPAWIYWYSDTFNDLEELHRQDITNIPVVIDWNIDFPLDDVLSYTRPRRIDKKDKTGYSFDIEFYHYSFPDTSIEFYFQRGLNKKEMENLNIFFNELYLEGNKQQENKAINFYYINEQHINNNGSVVRIEFDFGLNNNSKTIMKLLQQYSKRQKILPTIKVCIK